MKKTDGSPGAGASSHRLPGSAERERAAHFDCGGAFCLLPAPPRGTGPLPGWGFLPGGNHCRGKRCADRLLLPGPERRNGRRRRRGHIPQRQRPPGMSSSWRGGFRRRLGAACSPSRSRTPTLGTGTPAWSGPTRSVGDNARPQLAEPQAEGLEQYGTVFLGYPNWWYGVPMALLSFLEQNDLSGKDVYLFCSHGSGGLARSVEQISEAAPEAVISQNIFDCYEEEAPASQEDIKAWVRNWASPDNIQLWRGRNLL